MLGTNPQNIPNFTKPQPPDIKKPTFGARFNSTEEARAALRGKSLGTLPEVAQVQEKLEVQEVQEKLEVKEKLAINPEEKLEEN